MLNPFLIDGAAGPDAFCDRLSEREELRERIERGERVLVVGDRYVGKTSLVRRVLTDLPDREWISVAIDLRGVVGRISFVDAAAGAFTQAAAADRVSLQEAVRSLFSDLSFAVRKTEAGLDRLRFEDPATEVSDATLQNVFHAPVRIMQRDRRRVVVFFDHIDRLADLADQVLFRALAEAVRVQSGVAFLFAAGRRRLGEKLFMENAGPLGGLAEPFEIGPIAYDHWIPFIRSRFFRARKIVEKETVSSLVALTGGHPRTVQRIAYALWELTAPDEIATERRLERAVDLMLLREAAVYRVLWESLSLNQQRLLRALALEPPGPSLFSASFIRTSHLGTASSVQRALQSLVDRDLVMLDAGAPRITDRFLGLWIQRGT